MTGKEMWDAFIKENGAPSCEFEQWAFGADADELARLVKDGIKTATASAYPMYELEGEALPEEGSYSVILDSSDNAVCVIKTLKVSVIPFNGITSELASMEGEGDRSLRYWREVHEKFFTEELSTAGLVFTHDMKVVFEEFTVVYK